MQDVQRAGGLQNSHFALATSQPTKLLPAMQVGKMLGPAASLTMCFVMFLYPFGSCIACELWRQGVIGRLAALPRVAAICHWLSAHSSLATSSALPALPPMPADLVIVGAGMASHPVRSIWWGGLYSNSELVACRPPLLLPSCRRQLPAAAAGSLWRCLVDPSRRRHHWHWLHLHPAAVLPHQAGRAQRQVGESAAVTLSPHHAHDGGGCATLLQP